ncbi:hypothetical protein C8R45DRAFT_1213540 [Mycena sanguinolenta]|nr:hypothetical protein C8R45DRAFT_1213540 [Mycena sanguinolenta]
MWKPDTEAVIQLFANLVDNPSLLPNLRDLTVYIRVTAHSPEPDISESSWRTLVRAVSTHRRMEQLYIGPVAVSPPPDILASLRELVTGGVNVHVGTEDINFVVPDRRLSILQLFPGTDGEWVDADGAWSVPLQRIRSLAIQSWNARLCTSGHFSAVIRDARVSRARLDTHPTSPSQAQKQFSLQIQSLHASHARDDGGDDLVAPLEAAHPLRRIRFPQRYPTGPSGVGGALLACIRAASLRSPTALLPRTARDHHRKMAKLCLPLLLNAIEIIGMRVKGARGRDEEGPREREGRDHCVRRWTKMERGVDIDMLRHPVRRNLNARTAALARPSRRHIPSSSRDNLRVLYCRPAAQLCSPRGYSHAHLHTLKRRETASLSPLPSCLRPHRHPAILACSTLFARNGRVSRATLFRGERMGIGARSTLTSFRDRRDKGADAPGALGTVRAQDNLVSLGRFLILVLYDTTSTYHEPLPLWISLRSTKRRPAQRARRNLSKDSWIRERTHSACPSALSICGALQRRAGRASSTKAKKDLKENASAGIQVDTSRFPSILLHTTPHSKNISHSHCNLPSPRKDIVVDLHPGDLPGRVRSTMSFVHRHCQTTLVLGFPNCYSTDSPALAVPTSNEGAYEHLLAGAAALATLKALHILRIVAVVRRLRVEQDSLYGQGRLGVPRSSDVPSITRQESPACARDPHEAAASLRNTLQGLASRRTSWARSEHLGLRVSTFSHRPRLADRPRIPQYSSTSSGILPGLFCAARFASRMISAGEDAAGNRSRARHSQESSGHLRIASFVQRICKRKSFFQRRRLRATRADLIRAWVTETLAMSCMGQIGAPFPGSSRGSSTPPPRVHPFLLAHCRPLQHRNDFSQCATPVPATLLLDLRGRDLAAQEGFSSHIAMSFAALLDLLSCFCNCGSTPVFVTVRVSHSNGQSQCRCVPKTHRPYFSTTFGDDRLRGARVFSHLPALHAALTIGARFRWRLATSAVLTVQRLSGAEYGSFAGELDILLEVRRPAVVPRGERG